MAILELIYLCKMEVFQFAMLVYQRVHKSVYIYLYHLQMDEITDEAAMNHGF